MWHLQVATSYQGNTNVRPGLLSILDRVGLRQSLAFSRSFLLLKYFYLTPTSPPSYSLQEEDNNSGRASGVGTFEFWEKIFVGIWVRTWCNLFGHLYYLKDVFTCDKKSWIKCWVIQIWKTKLSFNPSWKIIRFFHR